LNTICSKENLKTLEAKSAKVTETKTIENFQTHNFAFWTICSPVEKFGEKCTTSLRLRKKLNRGSLYKMIASVNINKAVTVFRPPRLSFLYITPTSVPASFKSYQPPWVVAA
jgi:hypothetical protein